MVLVIRTSADIRIASVHVFNEMRERLIATFDVPPAIIGKPVRYRSPWWDFVVPRWKAHSFWSANEVYIARAQWDESPEGREEAFRRQIEDWFAHA